MVEQLLECVVAVSVVAASFVTITMVRGLIKQLLRISPNLTANYVMVAEFVLKNAQWKILP